MIQVRSALLNAGYPVTDEIPSGLSDIRVPQLPPGVVGVSLGERSVSPDVENNRKMLWKAAAELVIGLGVSGLGITLVGLGLIWPLLSLLFILPGSILTALGLMGSLRTDFRSEVIRVIVSAGQPSSAQSAVLQQSPYLLSISGGSARTMNRMVDRAFVEVLPDADVESVISQLATSLESRGILVG
jgi:hypothetical protein